MGKIGLAIICSFVLSLANNDGGLAKEKIEWLTLGEAELRIQKEPRPLLIDLYTDWCYWCKVMDKRTYNNKNVIRYINENYYAVKLNAETKDTLVWKNKIYVNSSDNKVHQFALIITGGRLMYPSTVIFQDVNERPVAVPGFLATKEIEPLLRYFGEGYNKSEDYPAFIAKFKNDW